MWEEVFHRGVSGEQKEGLLDALIRTAARYMLQVAIEEEVTEYLGRRHYERAKGKSQGYRNGYEPRRLKTAQGTIEIGVPQVRNVDRPFHSELLEAIATRSASLEELVRRMYVRGLSQRDVADTFFEVFDERIMSKSTASRIAKSLEAEFWAWRKRDLSSDPVIYLFLDAVYLKTRQGEKRAEAVLVAYGITESGRKKLLHLDLGEKESYTAWLGFLYNLVDRGVTQPILVVSDGNPGLRKAIREVYPRAIRQRCKVHKMRNILVRAPKSAQKILKQEITKVFSSGDYKEALKLANQLINRYQDTWPSAIACFKEDLEECLAHLALPPAHHKATGSTNLIERLFEEGRRRTKVVGRFPSEGSCLRLVFATLMAAQRFWHGVRMTPEILKQVLDLRNQLYGYDNKGAEPVKQRREEANSTVYAEIAS